MTQQIDQMCDKYIKLHHKFWEEENMYYEKLILANACNIDCIRLMKSINYRYASCIPLTCYRQSSPTQQSPPNNPRK
jgi:hypothetical protein